MQKSTYAVAGVQMQPGMRMNVRSHVYMPDAEAGREDERQQYFAGSTTERISRQPVTIRKGTAALLLLLAVLVVGGLCVGRMQTVSRLRTQLNGDITAIQQVENELAVLQANAAEAASPVRISYTAEQEYHMISSNAVESVPVTAPATRPI